MAGQFLTLIHRVGRRGAAAHRRVISAGGVGTLARSLAFALLLGLLGALLSACGSEEKGSAGEGLAVGDVAPAFSLPAAGGGTVSLAAYRGQPVLLFFHMADG